MSSVVGFPAPVAWVSRLRCREALAASAFYARRSSALIDSILPGWRITCCSGSASCCDMIVLCDDENDHGLGRKTLDHFDESK